MEERYLSKIATCMSIGVSQSLSYANGTKLRKVSHIHILSHVRSKQVLSIPHLNHFMAIEAGV